MTIRQDRDEAAISDGKRWPTTNSSNMKIVWYILVVIFGAFGILGLLRTIEVLVAGDGFRPTTLLIAIIMLLIAIVCFRKARAGATQKK